VRGYGNGMSQDPLPYPPYQTSTNASAVIGNQADFVAYWASIASELKNYPNVIFELWNEPCGAGLSTWISAMQQCITAIRATGATQPIICTHDMACWVGLEYPPPPYGICDAGTMDWVATSGLTDSLNNLIYSTHFYTTYSHISSG
jgi:hypothetical protein